MFTATDAILTAAGFLGFSAAGLTAASDLEQLDPELGAETPPSRDLFSPGELYFEAVASELREHGFLND